MYNQKYNCVQYFHFSHRITGDSLNTLWQKICIFLDVEVEVEHLKKGNLLCTAMGTKRVVRQGVDRKTNRHTAM